VDFTVRGGDNKAQLLSNLLSGPCGYRS